MPDLPPLNNIPLPTFLRQPDLNSSRNQKLWPFLYPLGGLSPPVLSPPMPKLARIETTRPPHNFSPLENLTGPYRGMHHPFDFALNNYKNLPQPQAAPKAKPDQASMGSPEGEFVKGLFPETERHKRPSVIQKPGKVQLQYNEVSSILSKVQRGGEMQGAVDPIVSKDEDPEDIRMIDKYLHKKFGKCFTTT